MDEQSVRARLVEVEKVLVNTQANVYAMQGQIIELKFWLSEFERLKAAQESAKLALFKKEDERV